GLPDRGTQRVDPLHRTMWGMADRLTEYRRKRDPGRTPEPVPAGAPGTGHGDRYVIQQHHARSLHWDLRLERDGVLVSWAVPRGLQGPGAQPPRGPHRGPPDGVPGL